MKLHKIKSKVIAVAIIATMMSSNAVYAKEITGSDAQYFIDKITDMKDGAKKDVGINLIENNLVKSDTPNVDTIKNIIKTNASESDKQKLAEKGYTVDDAVNSLDVLKKLSKEDAQKLVDGMRTSDKAKINEALSKALSTNTSTGGSSGGGGGGGGGGSTTTTTQPTTPATTTQPTAPVTSTQQVTSPNSNVQTNLGTFVDTESHWANEAIKELSARGVVSGYEGNEFRPQKTVSRAEFATMLIKLMKIDGNVEQSDFSDVTQADWYYKPVMLAKQKGIVSGTGLDSFGPNGEITREQMMVMILRAAKQNNIVIDSSKAKEFNDTSNISEYALESIKMASAMGIISGDENNNFNPKGKATRAEAAIVMKKLLDLMK